MKLLLIIVGALAVLGIGLYIWCWWQAERARDPYEEMRE